MGDPVSRPSRADTTPTGASQAAIDRPDEIPAARCQRWRLHRPHHWSTGGPLKACPGVAEESDPIDADTLLLDELEDCGPYDDEEPDHA